MNNVFQNRINDAIIRGVKLGLDLYDNEDIQDTDLEKDLLDVLKLKEFKAFDPCKYIKVENIYFFMNGDTKYLWLFKHLCCNYCDAYYGVYHIDNDGKFLKLLIEKLCVEFGNSINLNWIDVYNVKNMSYIFYDSKFNGDISKWDVSNVENMTGMFLKSKFTGDISKWDVSSVRNMNYMFKESKFNGDISKWDVSNVHMMESIFKNAVFNQDIISITWNLKSVQEKDRIFDGSKINNWRIAYDIP